MRALFCWMMAKQLFLPSTVILNLFQDTGQIDASSWSRRLAEPKQVQDDDRDNI